MRLKLLHLGENLMNKSVVRDNKGRFIKGSSGFSHNHHSLETKMKMEKAWSEGKHPVTKKMIEALKLGGYTGRKHSKATKLKLSLCQKGHPINENQRRGLRAGHIKHSDTKPEKITKVILNQNGINYISQFPVGKYTADFYIEKNNLLINIDGLYWHNYPNGRDVDKKRNEYMSSQGFKVLTLWENEIYKLKNILEGGDNTLWQ